jgi:hypothetical protein
MKNKIVIIAFAFTQSALGEIIVDCPPQNTSTIATIAKIKSTIDAVENIKTHIKEEDRNQYDSDHYNEAKTLFKDVVLPFLTSNTLIKPMIKNAVDREIESLQKNNEAKDTHFDRSIIDLSKLATLLDQQRLVSKNDKLPMDGATYLEEIKKLFTPGGTAYKICNLMTDYTDKLKCATDKINEFTKKNLKTKENATNLADSTTPIQTSSVPEVRAPFKEKEKSNDYLKPHEKNTPKEYSHVHIQDSTIENWNTPLKSYEDLNSISKTEESFRFKLGLPSNKINTTNTRESLIANEYLNQNASAMVFGKPIDSEKYAQISADQREKLRERFKSDIDAVFERDIQNGKNLIQNPTEEYLALRRKLEYLAFQFQLRLIPSTGNGRNESDKKVQTYGVSMLMSQIPPVEFRDKTSGLLDSVNRIIPNDKKMSIQDLKKAVSEYANGRSFQTYARHEETSAKVQQVASKDDYESFTLVGADTKAYENLKNAIENSPQKKRIHETLMNPNLPQNSKEDQSFNELAQQYQSLINSDQTGIVVSPLKQGGQPIVLIKYKKYVPEEIDARTKAARFSKSNGSSGSNGLNDENADRKSWKFGYIFDKLNAPKIQEYIEHLNQAGLNGKVDYVWKDTPTSRDRFLLAVPPQGSEHKIAVLVGNSSNVKGEDFKKINAMRDDLPTPTGLIDLRSFESRFK